MFAGWHNFVKEPGDLAGNDAIAGDPSEGNRLGVHLTLLYLLSLLACQAPSWEDALQDFEKDGVTETRHEYFRVYRWKSLWVHVLHGDTYTIRTESGSSSTLCGRSAVPHPLLDPCLGLAHACLKASSSLLA